MLETFLEYLKDFQVLAASIIALGAAVIGYRGVVHTQSKTLERQETARQQELQQRRETISSALLGELSVLKDRVEGSHMLMEQSKKDWEQIIETHGDETFDDDIKIMKAPILETKIFDQHINQIGIFPPSLAYSIVQCYTRVKGFGEEPDFDRNSPDMVQIYYRFAAVDLGAAAREIKDTVLRLHAVRLGHPDPGKGKGEEFWKDHGNPEEL